MPNTTKISDINEIKEDLNSLKQNVVSLTKNLKKEAVIETATLTENIRENIAEGVHGLKTTTQEKLALAEAQIKKRPSQSVALAFGAGVALSLLLNRK